jgi:hypothetical protein
LVSFGYPSSYSFSFPVVNPTQQTKADTKPSIPPTPVKRELDLSVAIQGLYRILDLVREQGSGGLVDKIIIAQDSFMSFINAIEPRSCPSMIKCDFAALDQSIYNVVGVYGDRGEITRYLHNLSVIDAEH